MGGVSYPATFGRPAVAEKYKVRHFKQKKSLKKIFPEGPRENFSRAPLWPTMYENC